MKKFFALIAILSLLFVEAVPVFALSRKKNNVENLAIGILGTVINEAVKADRNAKENRTSKSLPSGNSRQPAASMTIEEFYQTKEYERLMEIGFAIESDLRELGNKILAYNKPALDVKLTRQERLTPDLDDYENEVRSTPSPVMYSRVCIKGRTIVLGSAEKNKKFTADFIITGEPDFPPSASRNDIGGNAKSAPRIYIGQDISVLENYVGMSAEEITRIQNMQTGKINLDPTSFVFTNLAYKDGKITELHHHNGYSLNSAKAWNFAGQKAKEIGLVFASELGD